MKYLYLVQVQKDDASMVQNYVLAMDTTANNVTTVAAVNAINWAMTQAGAGSVLVNCNRVGQVDHDTTV